MHLTSYSYFNRNCATRDIRVIELVTGHIVVVVGISNLFLNFLMELYKLRTSEIYSPTKQKKQIVKSTCSAVVMYLSIITFITFLFQGLIDLLKSAQVDGVEIKLGKIDSKSDIDDFISTIRSKLGSDLYIVVSVPPKADLLAKYYDFKSLSKNADLFVLQTAFLGANKNVTFHPSRLSGLWDMQNTVSNKKSFKSRWNKQINVGVHPRRCFMIFSN